jgi:hypothetical protein
MDYWIKLGRCHCNGRLRHPSINPDLHHLLGERNNTLTEQRRSFLNRAGKVAIATPPALALLLKAEGRHYALALSGGGNGNGNGNSNNNQGNNNNQQ